MGKGYCVEAAPLWTIRDSHCFVRLPNRAGLISRAIRASTVAMSDVARAIRDPGLVQTRDRENRGLWHSDLHMQSFPIAAALTHRVKHDLSNVDIEWHR